ncbi:hypothetical protein [Streptomyces boncukensis]|uniref:Lipoprotein n=1 Tax=Streptomyces boncukensis TaxID=2711219 RepID=A0A6G4WSY6_9ACTN|nr:hypothetical protein [Streptomyces boncukensis]
MAGRRRTGRTAGGVVSAALVLALVGSCDAAGGDSGDGTRADRAAVQRLLDRQAAAVRNGNERAYLATVTSPGPFRRTFRNLRKLPLAEWSYRVTRVTPDAGDGTGGTAEARLRYRLKGHDRAASTAVEKLELVRAAGRWRVSGEAADSERQLWEQGELTVVRGERSLVLGVGRSRRTLRALARTADRAVPAVSGAWPRDWQRTLVVEAPASVPDLARLLGEPASAAGTYEGIAAVTTGEAGGPGRRDAPADRIVVNPRAYGVLSAEGRQIVTTHEATHVATRRQTTSATPMWLSEGLADWVAYRSSPLGRRGAAAIAPELAREVRETGPPRALPTDRDFRFGSDADQLARAYQGGWLACRMIAERWGERRLVSLYERVGRSGTDTKGADRALRAELGVGEKEFTGLWRTYVRERLAE